MYACDGTYSRNRLTTYLNAQISSCQFSMRQSKQIAVDRCVNDRLYVIGLQSCLSHNDNRKEGKRTIIKQKVAAKEKTDLFSLSFMLFLCRHLTEDEKKIIYLHFF